MTYRRTARVALLFLSISVVFCAKRPDQTTYRAIGNKIYAGTRPEIELLAGVLTQTSWMERCGPSGKGNAYYRELKAFFDAYRDHEAIKIAERLTQHYFAYDAPLDFMLQLSGLPELNAPPVYSDHVIEQAGGTANLEEFRIALARLAKRSDFITFYNQHTERYRRWTDTALSDYPADSIIGWMEDYFGWIGDEYHLIFSPAMFPFGGYAITHRLDGKTVAYEVVRENGESDSLPEFQSGRQLILLSLHEFGHSFVNPSLERCTTLMREYKLERLIVPVKGKMDQMAYGRCEAFFNETVVRAATARAIWLLWHSKPSYDKYLAYERSNGFYLIDFTIAQLIFYEKTDRPTGVSTNSCRTCCTNTTGI